VTAVGVAAALVLAVFQPGPVSPGGAGETREKGAPGVVVFIKRGDQVFAWDGRALRPGDRLRLQVAGTDFTRISVASLGDEGPAVLYEGAVGRAPALLPLSFRVDERGSEERLSVILGHSGIPPSLHTATDPPGVWRRVLTFPKR
jgi:hypothetical protein